MRLVAVAGQRTIGKSYQASIDMIKAANSRPLTLRFQQAMPRSQSEEV
eukprot:SAG31_NODE_1406_length_8487_cov_4.584883_5_plen_48_part_00